MEDKRRQRSYMAGAQIAKERMRVEAPLDAAALAAVEASDVVVVRGCYDHVERVLGALEMPFTAIGATQLAGLRLGPEQLLVVNCPGTDLVPRDINRIADFVGAGGSLFTTDWALPNVVQKAFPNTIEHNGRSTADEVVGVEIRDHDNPFLAGVMDGADEPVWWLEGASHPIRVLDRERVQVLIESSELGRRYGEPAVAVLFNHGDGEVFHMISHYYLQRTELRTKRQTGAASGWAAEKGVAMSPAMAESLEGLSLGEVESAGTSARLFANVVAQKKRKVTR